MDKEKYISFNNLNFNNVPDARFIEYYGSTLKDMLQFGKFYYGAEEDELFPMLAVYLEVAGKKTNLSFNEELMDSISHIIHTDEIFLISKDSDGDVYMLMQSFTSDVVEMITVLSKKHKMKFEIGPAVLEINFTQIWFYPSK